MEKQVKPVGSTAWPTSKAVCVVLVVVAIVTCVWNIPTIGSGSLELDDFSCMNSGTTADESYPKCKPLGSHMRAVYPAVPAWLRGSDKNVTYKTAWRTTYRTAPIPGYLDADNGLVRVTHAGNHATTYISLTRRINASGHKGDGTLGHMQLMHVMDSALFSIRCPCQFGVGADIRTFIHEEQVWGYTHAMHSRFYYPFLFNLNTGQTYLLTIPQALHGRGYIKFGKNYSFISWNGKLYFIFTFDSLRVLHVNFNDCTETIDTVNGNACVVSSTILVGPGLAESKFKGDALRGSTPGVPLHNTNLFFGIGHYTSLQPVMQQHPALWFLNMTDFSISIKRINMDENMAYLRKQAGRETVVFPMSVVDFHDKLFFSATESSDGWFKQLHAGKAYNFEFPDNNIHNVLFELRRV